MQLRRSFAMTALAVALTAGLSSCGFDYATDREYTPGVGTNEREGVVDVLAAVVVSTEPGSGTFVASLANKSLEDDITLVDVSGDFEPVDLDPVEVPAGELVNLADPAADIELTGDLEAGNFIELTLGFDNGESVVMDVPVVENAGEYSDLDGPAPAEEPTESETSESESDH